MIRSALQTILSKTLHSLLYKYVENLQVDDLEYPSVLGFVAGTVILSASTHGNEQKERETVDETKFGVHVKNVKLRKGAVIYTFHDIHGATEGMGEPDRNENKRPTTAQVLQLGEGGHIGSLKIG